MPLYTYRCRSCNSEYDLDAPMEKQPTSVECHNCKDACTRIIKNVNFNLPSYFTKITRSDLLPTYEQEKQTDKEIKEYYENKESKVERPEFRDLMNKELISRGEKPIFKEGERERIQVTS